MYTVEKHATGLHTCAHCQRLVIPECAYEGEYIIQLPHTRGEIRQATKDGCPLFLLLSTTLGQHISWTEASEEAKKVLSIKDTYLGFLLPSNDPRRSQFGHYMGSDDPRTSRYGLPLYFWKPWVKAQSRIEKSIAATHVCFNILKYMARQTWSGRLSLVCKSGRITGIHYLRFREFESMISMMWLESKFVN